MTAMANKTARLPSQSGHIRFRLNGMLPQLRHDPVHFGNGVREILLEAAAEIVQARLAVRACG